jgi:hypothetical protein
MHTWIGWIAWALVDGFEVVSDIPLERLLGHFEALLLSSCNEFTLYFIIALVGWEGKSR